MGTMKALAREYAKRGVAIRGLNAATTLAANALYDNDAKPDIIADAHHGYSLKSGVEFNTGLYKNMMSIDEEISRNVSMWRIEGSDFVIGQGILLQLHDCNVAHQGSAPCDIEGYYTSLAPLWSKSISFTIDQAEALSLKLRKLEQKAQSKKIRK